MLVHICCSVDSHFFLQKLKEIYPDEKLIGFFYDPNIHPYSEYYLRLLDVKRSCEMLSVELIEGEYDYISWMNTVRGYEDEPEKGERCTICFDKRVKESMKKALEIGETKVTTTLLTSPKKSIEQLRDVGERLAKRYGVEFVCLDFRVGGGTQEQFSLSRRDKLYRQDYCGCIYALSKQRDIQKKIAQELFESINAQVMPNSLEERRVLYEKRYGLEKIGKKYEIVKERFLNYRLLRAYMRVDKKVIPSYFLSYSQLKRKKAKLKIEKNVNDIHYSNREEVKILTLEKFNLLFKKSYKNILDLIKNPPLFKEEQEMRMKIENSFYSISTMVIVEKIDFLNFEIYCDATLYQDIRENLVIF